MMEGLLAQVKKDTRGVLLSRIGGVPLEAFNRDYRELLGKRFPYRDLGFADLRSCLESMDDTVRFEFTNDKWMLFGVADDHSFMSSPAIKAQFTQDKPINHRSRKRRNGKKKSSDSDDSTGQHRSKKSAARRSTPRPVVNGEPSKKDELVPNMKGLFSICLQNIPSEKTQEVIQLFSEVASHEEESKSAAHLFLRYKSYEEASDVISRFNGYQLGDLRLSVFPAREKKTGGGTDKKSQSSFSKEDKRNALSSSSKEKQQGKSPKEEAASRGISASSRTPFTTSNGTERQIGRQHREKQAMTNRTEANAASARANSRQENVTVQLPWNQSQANGDVLGAGNDTGILRNIKAGTDSKRLTREEPVESSPPVNSFSNRVISKPSLPSILDIADRLNSTKM